MSEKNIRMSIDGEQNVSGRSIISKLFYGYYQLGEIAITDKSKELLEMERAYAYTGKGFG